ncbi:alanyl-tRNA editing protein [Candidatus Berkiella cookevillensis]|uniref:Alanine--tRNA ligase n=1 Tax=Candidatus Berkiella cookevillensis TaxID=437022 RepID=A0A0Q9YCC9_9GAMM|nr:alanyl-tRNA editing protein [Candidatus Berkiella cookevillensis]MCS5708694.1 alanyl-tRNA editing protein [Candidatus Berkiella cookevillensis]
MQKIFWDEPYKKTLITRVSEVNFDRILLEETIAFSFSGGQESDEATIHGLPIIDSEKVGNLIYYRLSAAHGLAVGDEVIMEINWERRYRLMRLHFAAELILELVKRKLNLKKIGAHIAEAKARIDFVYDKNISHLFEELLVQYNEIIKQDLSIITGISDIEKQRRFWEIEGFSKVSCGGTHVRSTGEVGYVILKRVNIGSGKERIEIRLKDS